MVKVLPEPVTPSSTWSRSRRSRPSVSSLIAVGWSPAGRKSDLNSNGLPGSGADNCTARSSTTGSEYCGLLDIVIPRNPGDLYARGRIFYAEQASTSAENASANKSETPAPMMLAFAPVLSGVKWGRISRSARPAGAGRARGPSRGSSPSSVLDVVGRDRGDAAIAGPSRLWCGARARSIQRDQKCRDGAAPSTTRIASRIQAALNSRVTRAMSCSNACCSGRQPVPGRGGERQGRHGQQGDQRQRS